MSLRSMHESGRQQNRQEDSSCLELITQQSQRISELEEQISRASSDNSKLMRELQQKSETIVGLNEQIVKLSGSDLVLRENEELKRTNGSLEEQIVKLKQERESAEQEAIVQAQAQVRACEEKCEDMVRRMKRAELDGKLREAAASAMAKDWKRRYEEQADVLKALYGKKARKAVWAFAVYAFVATAITISRSGSAVGDCKEVFAVIGTFLGFILKNAWKAALWASRAGNLIPLTAVSFMIRWLIRGLVMAVPLGILLFIVAWLGKCVYGQMSRYGNKIDFAVLFVIVQVAVFFADGIRMAVPANLVLLVLTIYVVYLVATQVARRRKQCSNRTPVKG